MAEFLRFSKVKKTRKQHTCFVCSKKIDIGNAAYQWISTDGGAINSVYLHEKCGDIVLNICFGCRYCGEDDD